MCCQSMGYHGNLVRLVDNNTTEKERKQMRVLSNEFNFGGDVHRDVALLEVLRLQDQIASLKVEVEWFKGSFRKFYHGGSDHWTLDGKAHVQVNAPSTEWYETLTRKAAENKFDFSKLTHPLLYKSFPPKVAAVTFSRPKK